MRTIFLTLILVAAAVPAGSQEVSLFTGPILDIGSHDNSYGWQLEYENRRGEHFKYSLSYVNEGHATTNHRDGVAGQVWTRTSFFDPRFVLAAGVGPYYYFDTLSAESRVFNEHGWGGIASVDLAWYAKSRWFFRVRTNWIEAPRANTLSTALGVGYQLEFRPAAWQASDARLLQGKTTNNEITVFLGNTIVNNPDRSGHYSYAESIEYRRGLWRNADWTVGWIHENKNNLIERNGLVTQLWAVDAFFDDRLTLGAGLGPYIAEDRMRDQRHTGKIFVSGIGTLTTSYRFHPPWDARFSWSRIITDYDRDSDLLMLGIGYRF